MQIISKTFPLSLVIGVLASATVATLPASAAQLWEWSYSGLGPNPVNVIGGSGTFTTDNGPNSFLITGITGTVEGQTITGLLAPGTFGVFALNDNLLNATSIKLDSFGVAFQTSTFKANISSYLFPFLGRYSLGRSNGLPVLNTSFTATPISVPEPSLLPSLLEFGVLGGTALIIRRRSSRLNADCD
jgi:hypothetical protein